MATRAATIAHLLDCAGTGATARKMFGEYAIYHGAKVVALVCGDELFLKPTAAGRAHLGAAEEGAPYPGAKPHLRVGGEKWDEDGFLTALFAATSDELPEPKPRRPKRRTA